VPPITPGKAKKIKNVKDKKLLRKETDDLRRKTKRKTENAKTTGRGNTSLPV